jgi:malate dehydrogenase (oxaloacetate-decarboxylating)(NADP+)
MVTDGMFLDAAKALAEKVTDEDLRETAVYPELTRIRECSHAVACAVVRRAVEEGQSDVRLLENLEERVTKAMWVPEYRPVRLERRVVQSAEVPEEV